jgi:serine/threonine-protein kinase
LEGEPSAAPGPIRAQCCPVCKQHFSGDARFCPFDGESLQPSEEWDPGADPLLRTVVDDRYQVLHLLGEGGMGRVYRARHRALGRFFALKVLKAELARDGALSARFIQEAKAAAAVSHPNVVQITDFGTLPSGQPYFVMELLQGASLSRVVANEGPLAPARAVHIARKIAEALGAAHAAGVIHRDLKPDNIHVAATASGRDIIKVLDFGLAKVAGSSSLTRVGMVFGTPHYMSPEQASGEAVDHRADIYALGVVLFEMLTGRVPFEADTYMGVLTKHLYVDPPRPSDVAGGDPFGDLEEVVMRCLAKDPAARYESMGEVLEALDAVSARVATSSFPAGPPGTASTLPVGCALPRRKARRHSWPFYVGAVGLTGAGVFGLWWGARGGEPAPAKREKQPPVASPQKPLPAPPPGSAPSRHAAPRLEASASAKVRLDAGSAGQSPSKPHASAPGSPSREPSEGTSPGGQDSQQSGRKDANRKSLSTRRRPASITGDIIDPWAR